jgi:hypothetical protein
MKMRYEHYYRIETRIPEADLDRGFRAEVADPAWFLGKQWQMGEHQGEDASSPVGVTATYRQVPIDPLLGDPRMDPRKVPPEAIVESEPEDWWTPGRRIQLGAAFAVAEGLPDVDDPATDTTMLLKGLPFPYDRLNGQGYDGLALFKANPAHVVFAAAPVKEPDDLWNPAELAYEAGFTAGGVGLKLERHDGGLIDWYAVDAKHPLPAGVGVAEKKRVIPTRMQYPGAPHPRWWQIENARVDIGGFPPDRGHFATMLLVDLLVSHSDDWFTFPLDTELGMLVQLDKVSVRDSFDENYNLLPPANWSMFTVEGLDDTTLLLWPTVTSPLSGTILEEVVLGVDEDANLLWAVEMRADGCDLPTEGLNTPVLGGNQAGIVDGSAPPAYRFHPAQGVHAYWHPYTADESGPRRRFVQGRMADLSANPPAMMPEPRVVLLRDVANYAENPANQVEPVHWVEPATVPTDGLRLRRKWMLVRETDGQPRLWMQRERMPLLAPPTSGLHFDSFEETPIMTSE